MSSLHDPAVSLLLLFQAEERPAGFLCRPWASHERLALALEGEATPAGRRYAGQTVDGTRCQLAWSQAHDTHLLRLTLSRPGARRPVEWAGLGQLLDKVAADVWQQPEYPRPWAATRLYHALLPAGAEKGPAWAGVAEAAGLGLEAEAAASADPTPYGWLWTAGAADVTIGQAVCWQRTLALLTPQERAGVSRERFLEPMTQGLTRMELYLHKGLHHARQFLGAEEQTHPGQSGKDTRPESSPRERLERARLKLE
jgi:hypothetical protein